jgi:hypothetical protein
VVHAPLAPQTSTTAHEPPVAHASSATRVPAPPRALAASAATADLWAEFNRHCDGEESRITIKRQRERHRNIEDRNLEGEYDSLAPA